MKRHIKTHDLLVILRNGNNFWDKKEQQLEIFEIMVAAQYFYDHFGPFRFKPIYTSFFCK